ncbi:hypothetical protein GCM10009788_18440 [Nocardioides humi]|uniref:Uncharacterized protein n=1 Tax=Nocardioides humi TaxID=449461 RepID=A0ABN2AAU3_9ACTN
MDWAVTGEPGTGVSRSHGECSVSTEDFEYDAAALDADLATAVVQAAGVIPQ